MKKITAQLFTTPEGTKFLQSTTEKLMSGEPVPPEHIEQISQAYFRYKSLVNEKMNPYLEKLVKKIFQLSGKVDNKGVPQNEDHRWSVIGWEMIDNLRKAIYDLSDVFDFDNERVTLNWAQSTPITLGNIKEKLIRLDSTLKALGGVEGRLYNVSQSAGDETLNKVTGDLLNLGHRVRQQIYSAWSSAQEAIDVERGEEMAWARSPVQRPETSVVTPPNVITPVTPEQASHPTERSVMIAQKKDAAFRNYDALTGEKINTGPRALSSGETKRVRYSPQTGIVSDDNKRVPWVYLKSENYDEFVNTHSQPQKSQPAGTVIAPPVEPHGLELSGPEPPQRKPRKPVMDQPPLWLQPPEEQSGVNPEALEQAGLPVEQPAGETGPIDLPDWWQEQTIVPPAYAERRFTPEEYEDVQTLSTLPPLSTIDLEQKPQPGQQITSPEYKRDLEGLVSLWKGKEIEKKRKELEEKRKKPKDWKERFKQLVNPTPLEQELEKYIKELEK